MHISEYDPEFYTKVLKSERKQIDRMLKYIKDHPEKLTITSEDIFVNMPGVCWECGGELEAVRPGKVQCPECG